MNTEGHRKIFDIRVLIVIGIAVFITVYFFAPYFAPPAYAGAEREECTKFLYMKSDCFDLIVKQNYDIIDKLDWNNCVLLYKEAEQYHPPNEDLIESCGEMP